MPSPSEKNCPRARTPSAIPWAYTSELQSVKKLVEQHSCDLKKLETTVCTLQRKLAESSPSVAQRVEAVEGLGCRVASPLMGRGEGEESRTPRRPSVAWVNEALAGRVNELAMSISDLASRFELFKKDTASQIATSIAKVDVLQEKEVGATLPMTVNLQGLHAQMAREPAPEIQSNGGSCAECEGGLSDSEQPVGTSKLQEQVNLCRHQVAARTQTPTRLQSGEQYWLCNTQPQTTGTPFVVMGNSFMAHKAVPRLRFPTPHCAGMRVQSHRGQSHPRGAESTRSTTPSMASPRPETLQHASLVAVLPG